MTKVTNLSNGSVLSKNLKFTISFIDKLLGLLKKSNPRSIFFKTRFGIHTFFLKQPIDVIILDNDDKVVKLACMVPNKLFFWNPKYSQVLELPSATIQRTKTQIGDLLLIS